MIKHQPAKRDWPTSIALAFIHLGALGVFIPAFFSWWALGTAALLYVVSGLGITLGYHRLLTHRSLTLPLPLEYLVVLCGVLSLQGGPLDWVATHRAHHAYADADGDPHDAGRGMWWAHAGWILWANGARVEPRMHRRWVPDLLAHRTYRALDRYHHLFSIALGVALFFAGGWPFVIWGLFARIAFTYHCTWLVNSASHGIGYRTFRTADRSTNNWWVALLSFGEGWHNNHHAFPYSARHGLRWFEADVTFYTIALLAALRLATNVKLPQPDAMKRMLRHGPQPEVTLAV